MNRLTLGGALVALALLAATNAAIAVDPAEPIFGAPRTLPSSSGFGEPSIATAPDGTLYVTAPGSASALWRSRDGGDTWARVSNSLGSSGDSDVAIDANGVVYVSDLFSNVPVSTSFDEGDSFAYETATASGGSIDRQWLAASGDGNVFSIWRDGSTERIAVSHDRGVTFTRHVVTTGVGYQGNILATDDNTLWIPFTGNGVQLAKSTDAGVTWTFKTIYSSSSSTLFPAVAVDKANNVYVAWIAKDGDGAFTVNVAISTNGGATFSVRKILSEDRVSVFPWIIADAPGHVAVAWFDTAPVAGVLGEPNAAASAEWTVKLAFSEDAHLGHAATWSVQDATGVFHRGPICTMGTLCFPIANPVVGNRALLDFFELGEDADGGILIAYAADVAQIQVPGTTQTVLKVVQQTGGPDLNG